MADLWRALAPGVNEPSTAVLALDQIESLLATLGTVDLEDRERRDGSGALRLVLEATTWEEYLELGVSEIQLYGGLGAGRAAPGAATTGGLARTFPRPRDLEAAGTRRPAGAGARRDAVSAGCAVFRGAHLTVSCSMPTVTVIAATPVVPNALDRRRNERPRGEAKMELSYILQACVTAIVAAVAGGVVGWAGVALASAHPHTLRGLHHAGR
jgi:hypothetical protein